jgi:hypothetical protein
VYILCFLLLFVTEISARLHFFLDTQLEPIRSVGSLTKRPNFLFSHLFWIRKKNLTIRCPPSYASLLDLPVSSLDPLPLCPPLTSHIPSCIHIISCLRLPKILWTLATNASLNAMTWVFTTLSSNRSRKCPMPSPT